MNIDEVRETLRLTVRDDRTLACPMCSFTVDVPPIPVSDMVAGAFGMSGDSLARMHADMEADRAAHDIERHVRNHTGLEILRAVAS